MSIVDNLKHLDYNSFKLRRDLIAGLTVAAVSLPQGITYALVAGVRQRSVSLDCGGAAETSPSPSTSTSRILASTAANTATAMIGLRCIYGFSNGEARGRRRLGPAQAAQSAIAAAEAGTLVRCHLRLAATPTRPQPSNRIVAGSGTAPVVILTFAADSKP